MSIYPMFKVYCKRFRAFVATVGCTSHGITKWVVWSQASMKNMKTTMIMNTT